MAHAPVVEVVAALLLGGIGLPIPEELALVGAGYWIARGEPAAPMIVAAIAAVFAGDLVMYVAGRSARLGLVRRVVGERRIAALERACARWGPKLLLVARFVPGVRAALLVAAGAGRVSLARFAACDGLAALAGAALWIGVGHALGPRLDAARVIIDGARGIFALIAVAGVAIVYVRRRARPPAPTSAPSAARPSSASSRRAGDRRRALP